MRTVRLAVIPGDGIGLEVIPEALKILDIAAAPAGFKFANKLFHLGAQRFLECGEILPDQELADLATFDAILFGAVGGVPGDPRLVNANIERGLLLKIRFEFDQYVNLRPTRVFPGVISPLSKPGEVDFIVIREGTEGSYIGIGGTLRKDTPAEVATEVSVSTRFGVERVVRYAFQTAAARRGALTLVHKINVLTYAGSLWKRVVDDVSTEFPAVKVDYQHVDAAMVHMVHNPDSYDVIVTDNLFGDIITDLAAAISGGIGLAASANLNPSGAFPSMFEPIHGSAPDIAGKGQADPTAAILSVALLLRHLGATQVAAQVETAVAQHLVSRGVESSVTAEIGSAIALNFKAVLA